MTFIIIFGVIYQVNLANSSRMPSHVSFLEIIRPGGERLVDQLMISEELSGKELRTIAREYVSTLSSLEVLYNTRESALFDIMLPELKRSVIEVEAESVDLSLKIPS